MARLLRRIDEKNDAKYDAVNDDSQGVVMKWTRPHSIAFCGGVCHRSSKAARGEDLAVEEPVACGDCASFDFHPTLASVLGATLVGDEVVQVCQSCKKRLLIPVGMMEALHFATGHFPKP